MKNYELNEMIQQFLKNEIEVNRGNIPYQKRIVKRLEIMLDVNIECYMLDELRDLKKRLLHCLAYEECLENIGLDNGKKLYFELVKIEEDIEEAE